MTGRTILYQIERGLDGETRAWTLQEIVAKAYAYKSVGDPHALSVNGVQRWNWFTEDADKFIEVFGYAFHHLSRCSPDAIREIAAYVSSIERERDEALERSRDYPTISARLHDREKAREAEQAACADALARVRDLEERLAKAADALEPFNTDWATEDGWTDYACQNDRVVDWFGPSDFRRAAAVFSQIRSEK